MKALRYSKLFAAGAAVMMVSGGCASVNADRAAMSGAGNGGENLKSASRSSQAAQKAAEKGNYADAIAHAENAVLAAPEEAAYRARLGIAYQRAGRFESAEQAFAEARVLGDSSARTIVSHALSLTAIGKTNEAETLLLDHRTDLPATDYGLALSLLGKSDLSIAVLEDAVRNGPPSQQARQNLGFAYAMAGRWRESQMVAQQDLGPNELRERMTEWAQLARPGAYQERVASILGVTPMPNDAGMPVLLALDTVEEQNIASVPVAPSPYDGASLAASDFAAPPTNDDIELEIIDLAEQNMRVTRAAVPAFAPQAIEMKAAPTFAPADFVVETERKSAASASVGKTENRLVSIGKPAAVGTGAQYVVQLGAYSSGANAERAWSIHARRYPVLQQYSSTGAEVTSNGRRYHRVGATGFSSPDQARELCRKIRSLGGQCLVKPMTGFASR